MSTKKFYL